MSDKPQDSVWPLPKFYFKVTFSSFPNEVHFQEVSGLDPESQIIEYRHGDNKAFAPIKMPGINKVGNVTLKKGVFQKEDDFWEWYNNIKMNTIKRQDVVIQLLDETGNPTMTWTLTNAWPTKITSTDLKSDGKEVAVESIELAYEGLTIKNNN